MADWHNIFMAPSPLRLSPKARAAYIAAWRKSTGETLSEEAADRAGLRLLRLFDVVERASVRQRAREAGFEPPSV